MKNGELLRAAESAGFECLVTSDQNLSYQQNLEGRSISVITLTRQKWAILKLHLDVIQAAVDRATPGSFQLVDCGEFGNAGL